MRRRDLVLAAAAVTLAAPPARALGQAGREADVLHRAVRLEHTALFAYDRVLASGLLSGPERRLAVRLRGHEAEHAARLGRALRDLGWALPTPPVTPGDVEVPAVRARLDALEDRADALALLVELERLSLDAHRAAVARLRDPRHIQLAATILAAEASHLVAWRTVG